MKKEYKVRGYTLRYAEPFTHPHSGDRVSGMWAVVEVTGLEHPTVAGCMLNLHRHLVCQAKDVIQAVEDVEEFLSSLTAEGWVR